MLRPWHHSSGKWPEHRPCIASTKFLEAALLSSISSTMLQRTLLRSSRAIQTSSRCTVPRSPLRQPLSSFRPSQIQRLSLQSRWYSEASAQQPKAEEAPAAQNGDKPAAGEKAKEPTAEETLQKDLEAKNKEIVDLKVRAHATPPNHRLSKAKRAS